jgi:hypothetical protein
LFGKNLNSCVVSLVLWTPRVLAPLPKTVKKLGFTVRKMGNKKKVPNYVMSSGTHGPNNYKDTKNLMSSFLVFNRVYRLEIQSVMLVFSTPLVD